ncbi:putative major facilitator, sugar transporter, major facilitator superfamily [Septoria linicola]|nr:putative major facilitator, sugar transporter, major facilitator superfamily [Septoria linicola]
MTVVEEKAVMQHEERERRVSITASIVGGQAEAAAANEAERHQGFIESLRLYPKAAAWSVLLSTAIIMEGFDKTLINGLLAVPQFQRDFGEQLADDSWQITAAWQAGLTNGALIGEICGLMLNGIIADRFGYKKTMIGALSLTTLLIFVVFFAQSLIQLLIGLIFMGLPWGVFQTLTVTYAGEVAPTALRPYLTTYVNLCWVIGQFIGSGVLKAVSERTDEWAYRIPYGLQWIWPLPLIIGIFLAPESPWWLVRKERYDEAKAMLIRLTSENSLEFNLDHTIAQMKQVNDFEKSVGEGTSYLDCFRGVNLRRTEVTCGVWLVQTMCGATFMGYSTYFYRQAGLDVDNAFTLSLAQYSLGAIGVFVSWFMMPHVGRRRLYVVGQALLFCLLLIIGCCGIADNNSSAAQWAIGSMLLIFTFTYNCTIGPVCYSLVAELPSTRLRQKTVVLARSAFQIGSVMTNILTTRQLNPGAWNWGPFSAFFWAGTGLFMLIWSFFRLPEPKGRTYGELDVLFEMGVSARKFKTTTINTDEHMAAVVEQKLPADNIVETKS